MFINLVVGILSQCVHVPNHHIVCFKYNTVVSVILQSCIISKSEFLYPSLLAKVRKITYLCQLPRWKVRNLRITVDTSLFLTLRHLPPSATPSDCILLHLCFLHPFTSSQPHLLRSSHHAFLPRPFQWLLFESGLPASTFIPVYS